MGQGTRQPPGALSREIASILRGEIGRQNLPQGAVAKAAAIHPSTLSEILNEKKQFDVEQLDRVCFALGKPMRKVIEEAEKATASRHAERDAVARPV